MAIISCPECGQTLSTLAKVCPHCGFVIDSEESKKIVEKKQLDEAMQYAALKNKCVILEYKQYRKQLILRLITFFIPALYFTIKTFTKHEVDTIDIIDYSTVYLPFSLLISFFATMFLKDGIVYGISKLIETIIKIVVIIISFLIVILIILDKLAGVLESMNQTLFSIIICTLLSTPDIIMFCRDIYCLKKYKPAYINAKNDPITNAVAVSDETINKYLGEP